ncbi:MAG: hypothetical protein SPF89_10670 [Sphaerochaetaceae bacterium]|nr:hypothetical protein [Spirochaetales bacterium]MDY5500557.1 hypothetical protein [Sphaerochaetaceae bacterium]
MKGILYSYLLILVVLAIGLGARKLHASPMVSRKIIHMGVGNWWFVEMAMLPTLQLALVPPITFIFLNTLAVVLHKGESEEKRNYGLIYYPVALVVLVLLQFKAGVSSRACLWGVLVMAYGDSFAAIFGSWYKDSRHLPGYMRDKTLVGSLVMLVVSVAVGLGVTHSFPMALLVGLVATVAEAATPFGLDNLSVPILATLVAGQLV